VSAADSRTPAPTDFPDLNLELLARLSEAAGVSGNEKPVRQLLAAAVKGRADELSSDAMGNLIAHKAAAAGGSPDFRVMVAAHMDEVGLMVTDFDSDGSLKFEAVGGVDARVLVGQRVRVGGGGTPGVIGLKPVHLTDANERSRVPTIASLRIDTGADSKEAAQKSARRGDYVVFDTTVTDLGPTLLGKAFDDRAGCALLVELLADRYPFDLSAVFTVQEEVGVRGARVAAYNLAPHCALVLECGTTDDTPKEKDDTPVMRLGQGPAITVMDRSLIADRRMVRLLVATAEAEGIPYQIRAPKGGGTDAGRIHLAREGIPSAVVSMPCRYLHSPHSLLSKADFQHAFALVRAALHRLTPETLS
jgi:endoglucanase